MRRMRNSASFDFKLRNWEHSSANAAVQQEALIHNLRARAADAEPFERRLHDSADTELGALRDRLSQSEHRFSQTVDEKDAAIALLKAEIERLRNPKAATL